MLELSVSIWNLSTEKALFFAQIILSAHFRPELLPAQLRDGRGVKLDPTAAAADAKGDSAAAAGRVNIMTLIVNPDR